MLTWPKKILVAFLLGILAFTPWEILMVSLHLIEFQLADFWGIPWWVPLAFGLVTAGSFLLFNVADKLLKSRVDYPPNYLAVEYLLLSGIYLGILFFRPYPYLLFLGLLGVLLIRLIFFSRSFDYLFFLFGACLGPTVELGLTSLNLYLFSEPDFLGMPYWLPLFWGNVALAMRRVTWLLDPPQAPQPLVEDAFRQL